MSPSVATLAGSSPATSTPHPDSVPRRDQDHGCPTVQSQHDASAGYSQATHGLAVSLIADDEGMMSVRPTRAGAEHEPAGARGPDHWHRPYHHGGGAQRARRD